MSVRVCTRVEVTMRKPTESSGEVATVNTEDPPTSAVVTALLRNRRQFLNFLERRVGDRAEAEDILQDAFARGLDKLHDVRDDTLVVAWFYRVLRNALVDRGRRHTAKARGLEKFAAELDESAAADPELRVNVCRCVALLSTALKPEYREALQRIEVEGSAVKDYASETGISPGNAAVRAFRARAALRAEVARGCGACAADGCSDCTCDASAKPVDVAG